MQWVFGALIVVVGITLLVAGAQGSGEQLYTAVTGKTPAGSAKTSGTASSIQNALSSAGVGAAGGAALGGAAVGTLITTNPSQVAA